MIICERIFRDMGKGEGRGGIGVRNRQGNIQCWL
jgi:hypothetical protein